MMDFKGKHALIVEDDPTSVDVLNNLLSKLEITSTVVDGHTDIIALLDAGLAPDVVFLDLEMPGNSGYEVFEMLKEHPNTQRVPVVAYTTHISHANQVKTVGFHGFLGKPINRHEFAGHLEHILNGEPVWVIP
ncbi:MAG: response regulator [Anaerolineae bacterium]|nr:response regulator [Anaerolineae bacterium]